jgi:hypothetical protein
MGVALELDQSLPKALERQLQQAVLPQSVTVTVMNGGLGNSGPWQQRILLRERGFPLTPCVVIHGLYPGNDVENTLERTGRFPEAYDRQGSEAFFQWRNMNSWPMRLNMQFREHSAIYRLMLRSLGDDAEFYDVLRRFRLFDDTPAWRLPRSAPRHSLMEICLQTWYPLLEEGWKEMEQDVLGIQLDCTQRGIDFIEFCIPNAGDVDDGLWRWATKALGKSAYERSKDVRLAESFFTREGIPFVSVLPVLEAANVHAPVYLQWDGHLAPYGVEAVAEALAEFILQRYFKEGEPAKAHFPQACGL